MSEDPKEGAAVPASPPPSSPLPPRRSRAPLLALIAVLIALAATAAFWFDTRERLGATQEETARRLRDLEAVAREAKDAARQALDALREAQARTAQLEARLAESQNQQVSLEALYQELSRNRDEWQLAEIEQVLAIAAQQLQLAGNVRAALLALQFADARLAKADRPQFQPVRRAIARDLERLRALPSVDLPAMSVRLESLVGAVDSLPLAFEQRAEREAEKPVPPSPDQPIWARLGAEVWREIRQLVTVRQMDGPEPPLLAPTQSYFLRENLRLRLLNARLSLLARDEAGYRQDLRVAQAWIERYFDKGARPVQDALQQIAQLSGATLSFELPAISESLEALRSQKARRERAPE